MSPVGHPAGNGLRVLALMLISLVSICCGQIQCTRSYVTQSPDGELEFEGLPPGAPNVGPRYNPGPVGGWYSLAGGFVDVVRPGSLPYGKYLHM